MNGAGPTCVLLWAAGAGWEETALELGGPGSGWVVVKRCIDVHDLLATARVGQADLAVVAAEADGLDRAAVDQLHQAGAAVVVVCETSSESVEERSRRAGVDLVVSVAEVTDLPALTRGLNVHPTTVTTPGSEPASGPRQAVGTGPAVAVWGGSGAPGRTTVALGLAGAFAARGLDPLLLDLDPCGGAVAQHLGLLDDVSGLLASSRRAAAGDLTSAFVSLQRRAAGLRLLTGLPRADRWTELAPGLAGELLTRGRMQGPVVADLGWCVEEDAAAVHTGRAGRHDLTRDALAEADLLVVVGRADPVGLSRLARALTDLQDVVPGVAPHVVVNRCRRSLAWEPDEVTSLLGRCGPHRGVTFLPDDQATIDRAMLSGRSVAESGENTLSRAFETLLDEVVPGTPQLRRRRPLRRRRAAPALPR